MGLDTCTLIATRYDFPKSVEVLDITDKGITRLVLNRLNTIAGDNNIGVHHGTYEVNESIIGRIKEDDTIRDSDVGNVHVIHVISMFFSEFKTGISYEELSKQDPLEGKPMSKMIDGMKFFMMFEG